MTLALRLQRHGRKSRPFYHIVANDIRNPRDGRFKKNWLLRSQPEPSVIEINTARLQHYYRHGAQISTTVRKLTRIKQIALSRTAAPQEETPAAPQEEAPAAEQAQGSAKQEVEATDTAET